MAVEPKEWNLGSRRLGSKKSGGIHIYINSESLIKCGLFKIVKGNQVAIDGDFEYKQHPLKDGKVLIEFRKVKK